MNRIAVLHMFCENGFGRIPDWILALVADIGGSQWGPPAHFSDADRISHDLLRLAALGLWIIVEPVLRQIDDNPHMRTRRQNMASRDDELLARARQPGINPRVDSD